MNLAGNLKYLRRQKGLSQKELGEEIGTSGNAISNWEKGQDQPSRKNLQKILEFFSVSYDDITIKDLSKDDPDGLLVTESNEINEDLVNVIVRLERKLRETEQLLQEIADPEMLQKLVDLRDQLIKENPTRARELGLL